MRADFVRSVELSDSLDSLETAVANVETEYVVVKKKIDKILKLGWEQVEKRIDALHELETVQQIINGET